MLISLKTKFFRKLEDTLITFMGGLNVVRGPNEGGKTTTQEAIAYAFFGSKALRTSLEDCVTWGHKVTELKVELLIDLDGKRYDFRRAKAGAEVYVAGLEKPFVTGQNEVSKFAAALLGADAAAAANLMLASQGDLRGALAAGPKATMELIATLADFDLIDRIIDRAGETLVLGSAVTLNAALAAADRKVAEAEAKAVAPDLTHLTERIAENTAKAAELTAQVENVLRPAANEAYLVMRQAEDQHKQIATLQDSLAQEGQQYAKLHQEHADLAAVAEQEVDQTKLSELRGRLHDVQAEALRLTAFRALGLLKRPHTEWHDPVITLDQEMSRVRGEAEALKLQINTLRGDIRALEAQRVTASVCGFCQQDVSQFPEVERKNKALAADIEAKQGSIAAQQRTLQNLDMDYADLEKVKQSAKPFDDFLAKYGAFVEADHTFCPVKFMWKGSVPVAADSGAVQRQITALENQGKEIERAKAKREVLATGMARSLEVTRGLEEQIAAPPHVDAGRLKALQDANCQASADYSAARGDAEYHRNMKERHEKEKAQLEADYRTAQQIVALHRAEVASAQQQLKELEFNNTLVKAIKAAKPIISDTLWNTVLASVSTFFTQMRGEKSVVSKAKDGFKVNGEAVEALSGSTLDALALAIRVSLVKTFIPTTNFLILDEAFAACDDTRTTAALGFLAASGFNQVLLATHDEISESFADHLITL